MRRSIRWSIGAILTAFVLLLLTFAVPVSTWRSGREPVPPLKMLNVNPLPNLPRRVWIDTDAACGHSARTDVDDCLAIIALAARTDVEIVGISTVFGNASLEVTDRTTRELISQLRAGGARAPLVHTGAAHPLLEMTSAPPSDAVTSLRRALQAGPLTVIALGPLTNVALALRAQPELQRNVAGLIAIMGRRPGHLFHPTEGAGYAMLFGHGPVFTDFNVAKDLAAVEAVLATSMPLILVPYDAARHVEIRAADLSALQNRGGAHAWVAQRSHDWLEFWRSRIGREGFYPFDLMGALYLRAPQLFHCAKVQARIDQDSLWMVLPWTERALLVSQHDEAGRDAVYCPQVSPRIDAFARSLWQ